ncbi:hypothetical protein G9A89_012853 [Geosiphon pyriformis]|nr:hypothetical protein G9A89_012853 [Geosiphon pyriformis]
MNDPSKSAEPFFSENSHLISPEDKPGLYIQSHGVDEESEDELTVNPPQTWFEKFRKPHILWMIAFSLYLSTTTTSIIAPLVQFVLQILCLEYYTDKNGNTLQSAILLGQYSDKDDDICRIPEIQAIASRFLMWYQLCGFISGLVSVSFISTLSDYKGRRFVFLISCSGIILAIANIIFVAHYWSLVTLNFLFVGAIVEGMLGGMIAINTACHAYLTDCIRPDNRSVAFGFMHASAYFGMSIGPILGGFLIKFTGTILSVFYFVLFSYILFFLFILIVLPESVSPAILRERQALSSPTVKSIRDVFVALKILNQKPVESYSNSWCGRNVVYILAIIYFIYRVSQAGQSEIFVLYSTYKFHWTTLENGFLLSLQAFSKFIASLVFVPLLSFAYKKIFAPPYFRALDISMLRIGMGLEVFGFLLFATASLPSMFYFACVINGLTTIATPAIRSLFTTFVLPTQAGQILGALSVIEIIGSAASPLWMNPLYGWGVQHKFAEIIFWANAGLFSFAFHEQTMVDNVDLIYGGLINNVSLNKYTSQRLNE